MVIKVTAYAWTLLSVLWLLPSAIGVFLFIESRRQRDDTADLWVALVIWTSQLCLVVVAGYYWATERKRKVTVLKTEAGVDATV